GGVCWEILFMGVPSVLMPLADNEAGITAGLAEAEAAVHVGFFQSVDEDMLVRTVNDLVNDRMQRERLGSNARVLVDGRGATRVCRALLGEPESAWDREVSVSRQ